MSARYPAARYEAGDVTAPQDGDLLVIGWADSVDPAMLPGGSSALLSRAVNLRLESGQPEPRLGVVTPRQFNPGVSSIRGAGIYSDPLGSGEWLILADQAGVIWRLSDTATPLPLATSGITLEGAVEFVQAFDKVIGFRGAADSIWWNGSLNQPWLPASALPQPDDYTRTIPAAEYGVVMAGRLWTPYGLDFLIPSEIYDPTRYDPAKVIRMNQGEAGRIVALVPFENFRLIVLKSDSVHSLDNVTAALDLIAADKHSDSAGCLARKSARMVNGRLFWLGWGAVYAMSVSPQGKMLVDSLPLSQPIRESLRRINWNAAAGAVAAVDERYYTLAVPVDGSAVNNALLKYDHTVGQWVSIDTFVWQPGPTGEIVPLAREIPDFPIWSGGVGGLGAYVVGEPAQPAAVAAQHLLRLTYCGRKALAMIDGGRVCILDQNRGEDIIDGAAYPIRSIIRYRGMGGPEPHMKRLTSLALALRLWHADVTISVLREGDAMPQPLKRIVTDRTRWKAWGRGRRALSNAAADADADGREDYSLHTQDGSALTPAGLPLFRTAPHLDGAPVNVRGRWAALEIDLTRGFALVSAVETEALAERAKQQKQ